MPQTAREDRNQEALKSAVRESRDVLDHRIELVSKMDDLAMHTLRSSVIVIGILVSAAGLTGPAGITQLSTLSLGLYVAGGCCLFGAVIFGLATLSTSSLSLGISQSHRDHLLDQDLQYGPWAVLLLEEYHGWEREMSGMVEANSQWLQYELWAFSLGIGTLGLGTGVMTIRVVL